MTRKGAFPMMALSTVVYRLLETRITIEHRGILLDALSSSMAFVEPLPLQIQVGSTWLASSRGARADVPRVTDLSIGDSFVPILQRQPTHFLRALWQLTTALKVFEPVLLVGATCYKSHLIDIWSRINVRSDEIMRVNCSTGMDTSDLIGFIRPYTPNDALRLLPSLIEELMSRSRTINPSWISQRFHKAVLAFNQSIVDYIALVDQDRAKAAKRSFNMSSVQAEIRELFRDAEEVSPPSPQRTTDAAALIDEPSIFNDYSYITNENLFDSAVDDVYQVVDTDHQQVTGRPVAAAAPAPRSSFHVRDRFDERKSPINDNDPFAASVDIGDAFDDSNPFAYTGSTILQFPDTLSDEVYKVESKAPAYDYDTDSFAAPTSTTPLEVVAAGEEKRSKQAQQIEDDLATFDLNKKAFLNGGAQLHTDTHIASKFIDVITLFNAIPFETITTLSSDMKCGDVGCHFLIRRITTIWREVRNAIESKQSNLFLFQDGPVTTAVKLGRVLVLDNVNDLPAAVLERLNSLLETEPSFSVSEDFTTTSNDDVKSVDTSIPILSSFRVIATANPFKPGSASTSLDLSAAIRSRMTYIRIEAYSPAELQDVFLANPTSISPLAHGSSTTIITSGMRRVGEALTQVAPSLIALRGAPLTSRDYVLLVKFILSHHESLGILRAAALAIKFLFIDGAGATSPSHTSSPH
jgi:hypothetical protein